MEKAEVLGYRNKRNGDVFCTDPLCLVEESGNDPLWVPIVSEDAFDFTADGAVPLTCASCNWQLVERHQGAL
jgi:hypothetical protein